ncbi:hypothetical protein SLS56_012002 [Neofusicoccum ribis]|uniref:Xylanolytic transcriptional activator regulatory domain-containing protein n=1 Tax=Neofusicoccum ribis TaxID=45134 RepID=A0ABR3SA25_9PEZI
MRLAGRECVTNGQKHFRSVAAAAKEVERLLARVRELEGRPKQLSSPTAAGTGWRASPVGPSAAPSFYTLSSLPFFLDRMSLFLEKALHLHQPQLDFAADAAPALDVGFLRRAQEEHVLGLFWQTHYFSHPILDEVEFRRAFQALWAAADAAPDALRCASPLVDIVLALCLQLGSSSIRTGGSPQPLSTLAGLQYFQRCQDTMGKTAETSMTTVQCHILSIVYLREAGLLNRAQIMTGAAIMMVIILRFYEEPPQGNLKPQPQQELVRRAWWSVYILDAQLGIDVGHPPVIDPIYSTCRLPSDALELAQSLGPHYVFNDGCSKTWLGFHSQTISLVNTIRDVLAAFYDKCDALCSGGVDGFYRDAAAREKCARSLTEQVKKLAGWAKQVPDAYRIPRQGGGAAFSTDRSLLDLGHDVPIHWQRQRLLLELQYHYYTLSLFRSFICFAPTPEISMPLCDSKATASLNHAITLTNMVRQALTTSDVLNGVNQVFYWQKNALFTMLGFAYTFPVSHSVVATRKAIDTAIAVVEIYRDVVPEAAAVSATAQTLAQNVSAIISAFGTGTDAARAAPADDSGPSTSHSPTAKEGSSSAASIADEPFDLQFLQKVGEGTHWGDIDALWASLKHEGAGGVESWVPLDEAFALKESEGGLA